MDDDDGAQYATAVLRDLRLTPETVRDHVLRPDHLADAVTAVGFRDLFRPTEPAPSGWFYRFDAEGFGRDLHTLLSGCLAGYSMQLRRNGRTVLSRQWQSARTKNEGDVAWTPHVPMHLASVSKLITAIAMTRLLHDRGLTPDTRIGGWLPDYWRRGRNTDRITFRHLLTHTSGLNFGPDPTPSDFAFMKAKIEEGTMHLGQVSYQNCNFGLCRVLVSTVGGTVPTSTVFTMFGLDLTDRFWDVVSIDAYRRYVAENVFAPAGVSSPTLDHPDSNALAYGAPVAGAGWDSGDLATMSGGIGWHMSVDDLLDVLGTFRAGRIVPAAQATAMFEDGFGVDFFKDTPLGRLYAKGGWWAKDSTGTRVEQSNAYVLPKGMELAVLANSPFCASGQAFMGQVTALVEKHIQPRSVTVTAAVGAAIRALLGLARRAVARLVRRFC